MEMKNVLDILTNIEEGYESEDVSRAVSTLKAMDGKPLTEKKSKITTVKENFEAIKKQSLNEAMTYYGGIRGEAGEDNDVWFDENGNYDENGAYDAGGNYDMERDANRGRMEESTWDDDDRRDDEEYGGRFGSKSYRNLANKERVSGKSSYEDDDYDDTQDIDEDGIDGQRNLNLTAVIPTNDPDLGDDLIYALQSISTDYEWGNHSEDEELIEIKFNSFESLDDFRAEWADRVHFIQHPDSDLEEECDFDDDPWSIGESTQTTKVNEDANDSDFDDMKFGSGEDSGYPGDNDSDACGPALSKINSRVTDRKTSTAMADVQARSQDRPNYGVKAVKARVEGRADTMDPGEEELGTDDDAAIADMQKNAGVDESFDTQQIFRTAIERHQWMMNELRRIKAEMSPQDAIMVDKLINKAQESDVRG